MSQDLRDLDKGPKKVEIDGKVYHLVPEQAEKDATDTSGFGLYDTTYGHCAFCGQLNCNSTCFK